jgi:hypothetical protein
VVNTIPTPVYDAVDGMVKIAIGRDPSHQLLMLHPRRRITAIPGLNSSVAKLYKVTRRFVGKPYGYRTLRFVECAFRGDLW